MDSGATHSIFPSFFADPSTVVATSQSLVSATSQGTRIPLGRGTVVFGLQDDSGVVRFFSVKMPIFMMDCLWRYCRSLIWLSVEVSSIFMVISQACSLVTLFIHFRNVTVCTWPTCLLFRTILIFFPFLVADSISIRLLLR